MGGGGRDLEVAGAAEPGIDLLRLAEVLDPVDRVDGGAGDRQRALGAPALAHARQREPHHVAEAAVAPARPLAAALGCLEQDDPRLGLELLQVPGGPHPRVAAADHDDVGVALAGQRRRGLERVPASSSQ